MSQPRLLNSDSYGQGWLILIEPEKASRDLAELVSGSVTQPWLHKTIADWRKRGMLKV